MMLGNRGDTRETFEETLRFLERAQPHQYIFSCLSVYPGTRDYDEAVKAGWLDAEFYFEQDFQELKTTFDASDEDTQLFREWFLRNKGLRGGFQEGVDEYRAILDRLGDHHAAHMDLGGAYYRDGVLDQAEHHVTRALDLRYPAPGLALNYLACIAAKRGDFSKMKEWFEEARRRDPQHGVLTRNVQAVRTWLAGGASSSGPLDLAAEHDFQLLERTAQPTLPGPLPAEFASWGPPVPLPERPIGGARAGAARKLRVLTA
jgi:tetratricopeptide (TPR) repeat protein